MRWFCVAPDLPAKASLRIRAAPSGDADVCGRFSKGKAVAALSAVFQVAGDDESDGPQHWLHVTFPEETSGEWIEGFVMTQLPNGMTLLVPWEDAGFYNCCNITSDRAIVYEGPEPAAQAIGYAGEGEGTRFPYGVREVDGHRLRIFHDVHERVWVDAADVEPVCERLEHPKCSASHSFFALNEELPPEAQIAVRIFPSREAETRALLNRGQVIEVEMRCGSWLKIAGNPESWIMWRTDTWQLLTELPHHSSESCVMLDGAGIGDEDQQDDPMCLEDSAVDRDSTAKLAGTEGDQDPLSDHEPSIRKNSSSVTSLCDGLASHDISGSDQIISVDAPPGINSEMAVSTDRLSWDERPLDIKSDTKPDVRDAVDSSSVFETDESNTNVPMTDDKPIPESASWEDRPISSSRGAYDWEDRPLNVKSRAQSDQMDVEDTAQEPEEVGEVAVDAAVAVPASTTWEDRPISSSRGAYDWEDRPLNVKNRAQSDQMDVEDTAQEPEEVGEVAVDAAVAVPASTTWEDRPISSSRGAYDWEDRPLNVKNRAQSDQMDVEDTAQEPEEVGEVAVDAAVAVPASTTWEDRPISSSRGAYDWEDRPLNVKNRAQSDQMDAEDSARGDHHGTEENVAVETVQSTRTSASWEDRPVSSGRRTYNWEAECSSPSEAVGQKSSRVDGETVPTGDTEDSGAQCDKLSMPSTPATDSVSSREEADASADTRFKNRSKSTEPSSPRASEGHSASSPENLAIRSRDSLAQGDNTKEELAAQGEHKDWYWEEAPIKSRHARKAALEADTSVSGGDSSSTTTQVSNGDDAAAHWANNRQGWSSRRRPSANDSKTESPLKHGAVGVVSSGGTSVAWHSSDAAEDPGVFEESNGVAPQADATSLEAKKATTVKRSPNRMSAPAIGVVSGDDNSVTWHLNDPAEEPGVFDNDVDDKSKELRRNETESIVEENADAGPSVGDGAILYGDNDEVTRVENASEATNPYPLHVNNPGESALSISQALEPQDMDIEDDASVFSDRPLSTDDEYSTGVPLLCGTDDEADIYGSVCGNEKLPVLEDAAAPIDWRDYSARLRAICKRESRNQSEGSRILRAIALDEGADAILEALATTGDFDEELLKYEGPPTLGSRIVPSPSTSETALLDVLYSRDQDDGFSTPKKRPLGQVKAAQNSPYSGTPQSKEERLAGILRRTPQKAAESHRKIINNAKPEDILEAEFGSCSDELGLFGDYRYPTVSTPRFSTGLLGNSTRAVSAFGGLQSPSFTSSSFNSPPPKENPLKRSAAAIAKTPPVVLPKSAAVSSTPVMPSAPKPVVQVPTPTPIQVPKPSMPPPPPVRAKPTPSSLLPPSARSSTGLPRPSLVSPSALTSRLRAPSATSGTIPTPAVSRARSFTTNSDERTASIGSMPIPSKAAPVSGLARAQSMLPRKSALQAPSPVKFGITRTNSLASSTAAPPASETPVDPRRLSFGFSRPSLTKKQ